DLKDKHVLHFRLCQDGTWIGRYLNCIASSLAWIDAGEQCQNALSLIPLSLVRVKKENRENVELALSTKFINMFQPGQVMEIFGVEYNIIFSYSADYKMVSQVMRLAGPSIRNWSAFSEDRGARTAQEQHEILNSGDKQNYGYARTPLYKNYFEYAQSFLGFAPFSVIFCCSYKNIPANLLHMKLRIADILLKQAIKAACQLPVSSPIRIDEAELQLKGAFIFFTEFSKETKTHIQFPLENNKICVASSMTGARHEKFTRRIPLEIIIKDEEKAKKISQLIKDFFDILDQ
ncbi:unnamed protein product, partial [Didymodactylos carnosus]